MIFFSLLIVAFISVAMGLVVFVNNPKLYLNKIYLAFSISSALWMVSNALTLTVSPLNLTVDVRNVSNQSIIIFTSLSAFFFLYFSEVFVGTQKRMRLLNYVLGGATAIVSLFAFTKAYSYVEDGRITSGDYYWVFVLVIAGYMITTAYVLFIQSRNRIKTNQAIRNQVAYLRTGYILAVIPSFIIGGLASIFTSSDITALSPVFLISFLIFAGVAIVKHKLFDVRAIVARALTYVLSIGLIGVLYTIVIFALGTTLLNVDSVTATQRAMFALMALLIAVTYTPIINFFNKATSKLFFRDAYSTQEVLDQIGKIIVGSIDLHKIQKSTLEVLLDSLRPTYGGFVLKSSTGEVSVQDFVGEAPKFDSGELELLIKKVGKQVVVYDELSQTNSEFAERMRNNDISLIVPLITKSEIIGYFITGPKKSGNIFNNQDKSMITIAANELAVALQNAQRFEEIQAFNVTLQEKVDDATKELKKTNRKLVELDEAKDEFISMASHQLRTPLTSIKGYISMLMEGDLGKVSKEQDQALKEAFTSSQRMVFLISDFLNVSRIKTGKFVIEPKEVDLSDMVTQELIQLREMADAKKLKMVYEPPSQFPTVKLDDNKMHQVMMNMIDNAIYYTPNEGTITIQLYIDGKDVVFKVVDTGIGVPKAEQHKLFTKFFRAGNARKTRPDGTGLGLFMAQKVVVAQGGSIIFESEEGKGSTFGFRFTLSSVKA